MCGRACREPARSRPVPTAVVRWAIATARLARDDRPDRHTHLLVCPELVHTAEQRGDQIQGGVNLGFATAKDVSVEVRIAHPYDRIATHGGGQW
jgi:hypothetical protein